jgi:hypothetical protein
MSKRKSGKRTTGGRLSRSRLALTERNPPNDRALARQERFRHFRGDSSIGLEMTCAGRLMLVGAFDGLELAPEVILSALHSYDHAYWGNYRSTGIVESDYEREVKGDHGGTEILPDPAGRWFDLKDEVLRTAGYAARNAVHDVTVNRHWFPDEDCGWASRIINSRIMDKRKGLVREGKPVPPELVVVGQPACDSDLAMLDLLRHGALVLALGFGEKRRAA